MRWSSLVGNL